MNSKSVCCIVIICSAIIIGSNGVSFIADFRLNSSLQISTGKGIVQGNQVDLKDGTLYFSYQGIPYARPPLKYLRFRDPQPIRRWKGVLDATKMQFGCIEMRFRWIGSVFHVTGSEDCLYLNVYTPIRRKTRENDYLPVIFHIYGGAYVEGSAIPLVPDYLIQQDLIAVTFNYRGGIFGFLSTEDEASYGNYGLKDQLAALKWTRKNIKNFGGDPDRITMTGHSSGSISALYHMLNPRTWGLYCGVIAMSGAVSVPFNTQKYPRRTAFDIGLSLGIKTDNSTELVERIRRGKLYELIRAQERVALLTSPEWMENGVPFSPVIEVDHEDAFITKSPAELIKDGKFAKVPLLTGLTDNEMSLFGDATPLLRLLLLMYNWSPASFPNQLEIKHVSKRRIAGEKIRRKYFDSDSFVKATNEEISQMLNDLIYTRPMINMARIMSAYIPVYLYVFVYETKLTKIFFKNGGYPIDTSLKGAGHIDDLVYIWKHNDLELTPEGIELTKKLPKLWSNFAIFGNPTPKIDPLLQNITWPQVLPNTDNIPYLRIDINFSICENYRMEYVNFLNELTKDNQ